jgi:hypothetical protein
MSDAIEMTYLDISKRRQQQQEMNNPTTTETDAIPKSITTDESQQQHPLTTQSTFTDINYLPTIKDPNKTKTNRKVSTTTNDTTRKNIYN